MTIDKTNPILTHVKKESRIYPSMKKLVFLMVIQMSHQYLLFDLQFWSQIFLSALQAHEADDDSMTSHLEDSKWEMDKPKKLTSSELN